jgi:hypothetical protein
VTYGSSAASAVAIRRGFPTFHAAAAIPFLTLPIVERRDFS